MDRRKRWFLKNKDLVYQRNNERNRSVDGKYKIYKVNAEKRGFIFNLSVDEFREIVESDCVYCGDAGFGIDRIDNNIGYLKENCAPCCSMCNRMKGAYSTEEFIDKCKKISIIS